MIMMMIGLKITDQYVSFVYFNCGIKEINTEKIIPRELNMQLMQLRKRKPEKNQACQDSNPASCWEVSFETTHKRSARQIPFSLKPTKGLLCHGSLSITIKTQSQNLIGSKASTHGNFILIGPFNTHPYRQSHKDTYAYTTDIWAIFFKGTGVNKKNSVLCYKEQVQTD